MQIQECYRGMSLSAIASQGLGCYKLIPDFKDCCPLCRGVGCAVRHGLYYRRVLDADGAVIPRFPVPRFRCRCRGSLRHEASTFSVFPAALVPGRRFSLPLMLLIVHLLGSGRSIAGSLDTLAQMDESGSGAFLIEELSIYRVLSLLARAYLRLARAGWLSPLPQPLPRTLRQRALAFARLFLPRAPSPESALSPVIDFHRLYFPSLLLGH